SITESGLSTVSTIITRIASSSFCVWSNDNTISSTVEPCSNNA
ncbi:12675_t:CDS:1, partial [Funneliformis caledonium]